MAAEPHEPLVLTAAIDRIGNLAPEASTAVVPWWSFTKTLIAAAILRLVEQGRIDLDSTLTGYPFTPRQLLQHRAGVGDYGTITDYHAAVAFNGEPWSEAEFLRRVPPDELLFQPGTGWRYSNVGYFMLRRMIERSCDADFAEAMRRLVLAPLGLPSARVAKTRRDMAETTFAEGRDYHPGWVLHGLVIGPVAEAALALHRLATGDLLKPESRAAMLDRHPIGGPIAERPWVATGYGLGLMMGTMQGPDLPEPVAVLGHSAGGPGSAGAVYHAPSTGRTAAAFVAGHSEGPAEFEALQLLTEP